MMEYERKGCGPPAREAALLRVRAARYQLSMGGDPYTKVLILEWKGTGVHQQNVSFTFSYFSCF
jgi:hypothetical protein